MRHRSAAANRAARAQRMEDLGRVYFSSPAAAAERPSDATRPVAFIAVSNAAGERGGRFLLSLRESLRRDAFPSLSIALDEEREEGGLDAARLADRYARLGAPPFLFLVSAATASPRLTGIVKRGDISLLLIETEMRPLRRAYVELKSLARAPGGTLPAIVPVAPGGVWGRVAPRRLAEAAARFTGCRVPVWGGGEPAAVARHLERGLASMGRRREGGIGPVVRRLAPFLAEAER